MASSTMALMLPLHLLFPHPSPSNIHTLGSPNHIPDQACTWVWTASECHALALEPHAKLDLICWVWDRALASVLHARTDAAKGPRSSSQVWTDHKAPAPLHSQHGFSWIWTGPRVTVAGSGWPAGFGLVHSS